jgi:hypothetical protein
MKINGEFSVNDSRIGHTRGAESGKRCQTRQIGRQVGPFRAGFLSAKYYSAEPTVAIPRLTSVTRDVDTPASRNQRHTFSQSRLANAGKSSRTAPCPFSTAFHRQTL